MFGLFKSKTRTLIVVDMQNDFVPGGALAVPGGDEVVPVINRLIEDYPIVVATKDWHPKGHCSFASSHPRYKVGDRVQLEVGSQLLWPDHCVQGTTGAEFVAGLTTKKFRKVFQKGTQVEIDSYSGMFDNGNLRETGLRPFLVENQVKEVYVVGLATDYTVKFTAVDCRRQGLDVTVLLEGCRSLEVKPGDTEKAIREMKSIGIHVK
jgi:nicotinamidase/pyrazinamidase